MCEVGRLELSSYERDLQYGEGLRACWQRWKRAPASRFMCKGLASTRPFAFGDGCAYNSTAPIFPEAPFLERYGVMGRRSRYSPEIRERAVRMVVEHEHENGHSSQRAAMVSIADKIGCSPDQQLPGRHSPVSSDDA